MIFLHSQKVQKEEQPSATATGSVVLYLDDAHFPVEDDAHNLGVKQGKTVKITTLKCSLL
jgi:phage baseplate assembly protein gpV